MVFHEQVIEMIARFAGISYAEADEKRRALGDVEGMAETKLWFFPRALGRGYPLPVVEGIWKVLEAFASFGFCKAHAAAFALPTYQSAWLKAHWPAHFLAGRAHPRPGHVPQAADPRRRPPARHRVLGLDVNASREGVRRRARSTPTPTARCGYGIRLALAEVKGINEAEVERIVAARPYHSLTDFWHRARVSRPIVGAAGAGRRLRLGLRHRAPRRRRRAPPRPGHPARPAAPGRRARPARPGGRPGRAAAAGWPGGRVAAVGRPARARAEDAAARNSTDPRDPGGRRRRSSGTRWPSRGSGRRPPPSPGRPRAAGPVDSVQLALDLGDEPARGRGHRAARRWTPRSGCAPSSRSSASTPAGTSSTPTPRSSTSSATTRSKDLLRRRSKAELLVAGVKVATQTPPIRSGRRVIFLTLDDATGPVDATFFEDAQGPYAATVFHSWLLVVRGELRRTGRRGRLAARHRLLGAARAARALAAPRASTRCARRWPWCPRGSAAWASRTPSPGPPRAARPGR